MHPPADRLNLLQCFYRSGAGLFCNLLPALTVEEHILLDSCLRDEFTSVAVLQFAGSDGFFMRDLHDGAGY